MRGSVVVGVDGSDHAERALGWAAEEASRRGAELRVVNVLEWPMQLAEGLHTPHRREALVAEAQAVVDRSVDHVRRVQPALEVAGFLDVGHASGTLVERSKDSDLVVVGAHGGGSIRGHLLGATTSDLLHHAHSAVAVVRELAPSRRGEILVGVDDTDSSKQVLAAAFWEAALHGVGVHLLHTYAWPVAPAGATWMTPLYPTDELQLDEERLLAEASAGAQADFPDVPVHSTVLCESAVSALIAASAEADMVVLGSRGRGGFTGMLLGSVARSVAHHAQCPVLLVRL